jgi:16S rRNA (guanine527-N7)-methyltransferase
MLTIDRIKEELRPYGISADDSLCEGILAYVELLLRWNSKISLTSVTDPVEIVRFHFGESLFGALIVDDKKSRLADVGSGAGFPGLALKLYRPSIQAFLIEPNAKKAAFLSEVARNLNLQGVEILRFRMEDLPVEMGDFGLITARAVGSHEDLMRWSRNRLSVNGQLALWVADQDAAALAKDELYRWMEPLRIPKSEHRVILLGTPRQP